MSNGTNGETLTAVYKRLLCRNDVCLTDLCVPVHSIRRIWYTLAWSGSWCKSQLYSLSLLFYIHFYITCLASLIILSWFPDILPRDTFRECPLLKVEPRAKLAHSPSLRHRWHVNPSQSTIHRSIVAHRTPHWHTSWYTFPTCSLCTCSCARIICESPAITRASARKKCPYIASQCLSRIHRALRKIWTFLFSPFCLLRIYSLLLRCKGRHMISHNILKGHSHLMSLSELHRVVHHRHYFCFSQLDFYPSMLLR